MEQVTQIINRVLPIILLIFLGSWIRRSRFLSENTIDELRKLIVNLALPSVLFITFLQLELKLEYVYIFILVFSICLSLFGLGFLIRRLLNLQHPYFPFLMTGFEYGMLGVSLFGGAYGMEKLGYIAVMALGHELFIWFVFLAFLLVNRDGIQDSKQLLGTFIKSPVIVAVLLGVCFNLLGLKTILFQAPFTGALIVTFQFLANLVVPVILIVVGYSLKFDAAGLRAAFPTTLLRLSILIPLALALNLFFIRGWLHLPPAFEAALFTLLILPPPFIVPLYMRSGLEEEKHYVNNVLALYTIISIMFYFFFFITHQTI